MVLDVQITNSDFIFDFGDFQIETSKGFINEVTGLEWYNNCIMIETPDDTESIGFQHLLFGESPFYSPCDYVLRGRDNISETELQDYLNNITAVRWAS